MLDVEGWKLRLWTKLSALSGLRAGRNLTYLQPVLECKHSSGIGLSLPFLHSHRKPAVTVGTIDKSHMPVHEKERRHPRTALAVGITMRRSRFASPVPIHTKRC